MTPSSTSTETDPNRHVRAYLDHYLSLPKAPGYAVLVGGSWGIGKSYLVRAILDTLYADLQTPAYVSLYGLASHEDIDRALAHAIYPSLAAKGSKIAGQAARAVAAYFGIKPELTMEQVVNIKTAPVYVFDDLERVGMSVSQALGYINTLVEHDGQKVIVIAHEDKIEDPAYREIREKLIGKTLKVQSVADEALGAFLRALQRRDAATAMEARRAQVLHLYGKANVNNLRLLQQAIWEFERVFAALSEHQKQHEGAVTAILVLVFALTFEIKANRLSPEDLSNRLEGRFKILRRDQDVPAMRLATDRYDGYNLYDQVLSDNVLEEALFLGLVDKAKIQTVVAASPYLSPPEAEAEWRTLWHFQNRDEDQVAAAIEAMQKKFDARAYDDPGEVLHVFALQLWRARNGLLDTSPEAMAQACLAYIADLRKAGRLPALENPQAAFELRRGHDGLGFTEPEPDFVELAQSLEMARREALLDRLPDEAQALLELLSTNIRAFDLALCFQVGLAPKFLGIPILSAVDLDAFMERFARLSAPDQQTALRAIEARHAQGELRTRLSSEEPWLRALRERLLSYAENLDALNRFRVRQLVVWCIEKTLKPLDTEQ